MVVAFNTNASEYALVVGLSTSSSTSDEYLHRKHHSIGCYVIGIHGR